MTKHMTSKERLLTAIRHEEPDRVPVGPRVWAWLKDYYGSSSWLYELRAAREFDFDPMLYIDSPYPNYISTFRAEYENLNEVKVNLELARFDTETLIKRTIYTPAGMLRDCIRRPKPNVGYGTDPDPHWEERIVKGPEDLEALAFLIPQPDPSGYVDVVGIQDAVRDQGLVNLYVNSPIDHGAGWCMDLDDLMIASLGQPDFVHNLLEVFHKYTLDQTRCALEAGIQVIFTPWYFASMSVGWSPKFYESFILPLVKEQVELVHDFGGIYHYYDDGKVTPILNWIADAGVDILSTLPPPPMGDVDLAQAKAAVGDRICLNGNIDLLHVIKEGTPELIQEKVRQAILDAAEGGGFILGTSDSIRETSIENVRAYFEAGRRYGNYSRLGKG
jgi:uroporphyrinogen decarboxylase